MVSPCTGCGRTLEHDHDPRVVLCAGCERDKLLDENPHLVKPPTTEQRRKLPPPPPPMRRTYQVVPPFLEPGYRVLTIAVVLALGFFLGWIARGGV